MATETEIIATYEGRAHTASVEFGDTTYVWNGHGDSMDVPAGLSSILQDDPRFSVEMVEEEPEENGEDVPEYDASAEDDDDE